LRIRIEPLGPHHDRGSFTCGAFDLDLWFRGRASQDEKRNLARVFVAQDEEGIAGFYSLSTYTLSFSDVPPDLARKLPRYERLPAALIGRLARAERLHGRNVGGVLLADAIRRTILVGQSIAVYAILVDAKDERASQFYQRFGFKPFPAHPRRLFLLAETAARAFAGIG
jgi:GNAT superfamily N-acetyltransferase